MSKERHFFPGNNTPKGFYSYYSYILTQKEASRIFCIKGGPGVGKSSFMKAIAKDMLKTGEDIDYLHCSSDPISLDGIILKNRKIAFIDATSPHVVEPINPGAVDNIIHLGEYWDEESIRKNKESVMEENMKCKKCFLKAYNYLGAAEKLYDNIEEIYINAIKNAKLYKIAAEIVNKELSHKEITLQPGAVKKYFASAVTPEGIVNYLDTLVSDISKIYVLKAPIGARNDGILNIISEGARYRGFSVEEYYCSLKPTEKIEHLIIKELGIAIISENQYHGLKHNFYNNIGIKENSNIEIITIDCIDNYDMDYLKENEAFLLVNKEYMEKMIYLAVSSLSDAKARHQILEQYYIPNMDFKKIDVLRQKIVTEII